MSWEGALLSQESAKACSHVELGRLLMTGCRSHCIGWLRTEWWGTRKGQKGMAKSRKRACGSVDLSVGSVTLQVTFLWPCTALADSQNLVCLLATPKKERERKQQILFSSVRCSYGPWSFPPPAPVVPAAAKFTLELLTLLAWQTITCHHYARSNKDLKRQTKKTSNQKKTTAKPKKTPTITWIW